MVFPGGFGTLDELTEILTLAQTRKLENKIVIVMYGSDYWREIINFDALVRYGMIAPSDLELFRFVDTPDEAFQLLKDDLEHYYLQPEREHPGAVEEAPEIARSRTT